jgi:hypothetical protein
MSKAILTILNLGFVRGLAWVAAMQKESSRRAEMALKPGETIECRNATVLMDKRGEISWVNNNCPMQIVPNTED